MKEQSSTNNYKFKILISITIRIKKMFYGSIKTRKITNRHQSVTHLRKANTVYVRQPPSQKEIL